jgi:hypothetical protein
MKKNLLIIAILLGIVLSVPFWTRQADRPIDGGYPWQIEVHADGLSTVFGLTLGRTTFTEARGKLGEGMKLALLSTDSGDDSVEMYYSHFSAGRLSGRLVIVADLAVETLAGMRQRAVRSGGAHSFRLHSDDLPLVLQAPIKTLTFIPVVDLDKDIILQRFGQPQEIISRNDKLSHYLYPQKGLDLILDTDGKEVLQYIAPRDFNKLHDPLKL